MPWYEYTNLGDLPRPMLPVRLRRGSNVLQAPALVDSGADSSVFDLALAEALGLDPAAAQQVGVSTASGDTASMLRWPGERIVLEFAGHRTAFKGMFVAVPAGGDHLNLLGREDFLRGLTLQLWNDRRLFQIDRSPDRPQRFLDTE